MTGFWVRLHPILFFHGDSRKYDTFRRKLAVLFINLLGKGLTQEINGDGGSIWWAPGFTLDSELMFLEYKSVSQNEIIYWLEAAA